ncbi:MAG TPA: sulfite exporter TauE/SafE family protein [Methylomirabilota bacterium]|nr:sulfite exporter TauE/SafE family protein [Methylomirabilota bacterium]
MVDSPLLFVGAGALVGLMVGFTGVGGGSLMTPILVLGFGQVPTVAVGTDLVFAAVTKLAATGSFGHGRRVDWEVVRRLALGSVPGAASVLGWLWFTRDAPPVMNRLVIHALAVMLLVSAAGLLFQVRLRRWGAPTSAASLKATERFRPALTIAVGVVLGLAVTLTSVGAGALGVVALLYLYPLRLPPDRLVATDIAHALPLTIVAGLGHAALGHVDLKMLACLLLGSIPAVVIGSQTTIRIPPAVTRGLVAVMLMVVGVRILWT